VFEHRPGRHAIEALGFEIAFAGKALPDDSQLVRILGWRGLYARHRPPAIAHRCHEVASRRPDVERISGTTRDVRGLSRVAPRQATSVTSVTVIRAGVVTADLGDRWTRVEIAERTPPTPSNVPRLVIDPESIVAQPEENPYVVCPQRGQDTYSGTDGLSGSALAQSHGLAASRRGRRVQNPSRRMSSQIVYHTMNLSTFSDTQDPERSLNDTRIRRDVCGARRKPGSWPRPCCHSSPRSTAPQAGRSTHSPPR
jgi:hypothetical protein